MHERVHKVHALSRSKPRTQFNVGLHSKPMREEEEQAHGACLGMEGVGWRPWQQWECYGVLTISNWIPG